MLEVLLQSLAERIGNLMEADELTYSEHLGVVASSTGVEALNDGGNVAEDAGIHQS